MGLEHETEQALQQLFRDRFEDEMMADLEKMRSFRNDEILKLFKTFKKD